MSIIQASVDEQIMTITNNPTIASGGSGTNILNVTFDSDWDGFLKTAVFYQDIKNPYFVPMERDSCVVPWESTMKDGILNIGIFGVKDNKRITTVVKKYKVFKGALTDEINVQPPSQDMWQQIFAEISATKLLVANLVQEQSQFIQNQTQGFEEYKTTTTQNIKDTLEKYGDLVVLMDIDSYIEVPNRKAGSVYFNATERVDNSLERVVVMQKGGYIPPSQRTEQNIYFNTETTLEVAEGIKASPYVGIRITG